MRKFFLDRVQEESVLSGQAFLYLHYADMIANGYKRTMPCPFQTQGLLLNPERRPVLLRELGADRQRARRRRRGALLQGREPRASRAPRRTKVCPTCLSPCQVNVGAMKQFVPYAKFLMRAYQVKHDPARHVETLPVPDDSALDGGPFGCCAFPASRFPLPHSPHRRCRRADRAISCTRRTPLMCSAAPRRRLALDRAAIALVLVDRSVMAYRWMVLLCALMPGSRPPFSTVLRIFFVSTFVGTFLPSVGGDSYRAYSLSRMNVQRRESAASVLMDRVARRDGDRHRRRRGPGARASGRAECRDAVTLVAASMGCFVAAVAVFQ